MKTKRLLVSVLDILIASWLTCTLLIQIGLADPNNQICTTVWSAPKCTNIRNTICIAWGTQNCGGKTCTYCDDSSTIPMKTCVPQEGANCQNAGQPVPCTATANEMSGTCQVIAGNCTCTMRQPTNNQCGNNYQYPPCV